MHRSSKKSPRVNLPSVLALAAALSLAGPPPATSQSAPAFPWAEGFGARATGGRLGRVLEVTRLDDKIANPPEGTLRWALEQQGRRIVVFRVAGTIQLIGRLHILEPHVTIAGQTAPGGGITLRDFSLVINTQNVILQGIRSRLGARELVAADALDINEPQVRNVIVDHCSLSWSTDEVLSIHKNAEKITIQNSIISEGLDCSAHPEGCHSRGPLITDGARNITLHRNLFAHNNFRNPRMFGQKSELGGKRATFDFYNNIVYNWRDWATSAAGVARANIQGNFFKLGSDTSGYPDDLEIISQDEEPELRIYAAGNVGPSCPTGCPGEDDWEEMVDETHPDHHATERLKAPPADILGAFEAAAHVLDEAGASYRLDELGSRVPRRDTVDLRIVDEVINGTGGIIDDPSEVGGWPDLDEGVPVADEDHDGMPDLWEIAHGLDPLDDSDNVLDGDGDGYTNVEEYLFEGDPSQPD